MPRLNDDMNTHQLAGGFTFTGARIDKLGATDYTLVTVGVDTSGSVYDFESDLKKALEMAIDGCKKSPRSDNILVRVLYFSTMYHKGTMEVHGYKPLADIDPAAYPGMRPSGGTPLNDAVYSSLGATLSYGEQLADQDFAVNGIVFVITDGEENASTATEAMIKKEQEKIRTSEKLESLISILVGVNSVNSKPYLEAFARDAGMTQYVDVDVATPRKLAKLAEFVSQSVSSQAQALGTGGPSQQIAATI